MFVYLSGFFFMCMFVGRLCLVGVGGKAMFL